MVAYPATCLTLQLFKFFRRRRHPDGRESPGPSGTLVHYNHAGRSRFVLSTADKHGLFYLRNLSKSKQLQRILLIFADGELCLKIKDNESSFCNKQHKHTRQRHLLVRQQNIKNTQSQRHRRKNSFWGFKKN